jgi:hypothetical protein
MTNQAIAAYAAKLDAQRAAICSALHGAINELLPKATPRVWHAIPVWFMGDNPVVGYTARKTGVMLMFWNGQKFNEPELTASGSFHMAQIPYHDVTEIDHQKLAGWLRKAGSSIWDLKGERDAVVAKRRAAKQRAAKQPKPATKKPASSAARKVKKKSAPARKK